MQIAPISKKTISKKDAKEIANLAKMMGITVIKATDKDMEDIKNFLIPTK